MCALRRPHPVDDSFSPELVLNPAINGGCDEIVASFSPFPYHHPHDSCSEGEAEPSVVAIFVQRRWRRALIIAVLATEGEVSRGPRNH